MQASESQSNRLCRVSALRLTVFQAALFLVLATLITFWQTADCGFINLDDDVYVFENPHIRDGLTWKGVRWAFSADLLFDSHHADYWQPVTFLSRMLDIQLFGLNPAMHHLMNLAFHIANVLLLFRVLHLMAGSVGRSAFAAALFAVHPFRVESVAWVVERKDLLCGLFWMLSLWAYLRYVARPGWGRYAVVAIMHALGLMSKPMNLSLPAVLLLLDYWPLGRGGVRGWMVDGGWWMVDCGRRASISEQRSIIHHPSSIVAIWIRLLLEKLPLFALSVASIAVTWPVQSGHLQHASWSETAPNALAAWATYFIKTLFPTNLAIWHPHPGNGMPLAQVGGAFLLLAGVSVWVLRYAGTRPCWVVGWLWFLGVLIPVIGLNDIGWAERFTYLPSIGLCLMAAWGVPDLLPMRSWRPFVLRIGAVVLVAGCMAASWLQLRYWRDSVTLFDRALAVTGPNCIVHNNLGRTLQLMGRNDEARKHFREAVRIHPNYSDACNNLGLLLLQDGKTAEAAELLSKAVRMDPSHADAASNLGMALMRSGKINEAIRHYETALQLRPEFAEAHNNLGNAFLCLKRMDEAVRHYQQALQLDDAYAEARYNLANALALQGKTEDAIRNYSETVRLDPAYALAHYNLGICLAARGKLEAARRHLNAAIALEPNSEFAREAREGLARMKSLSGSDVSK